MAFRINKWILILALSGGICASAQEPTDEGRSPKKMSLKLLRFVSDILRKDSMSTTLGCGLRAELSHDQRGFSSGSSTVDNLTVNYKNDRGYGGIAMTAYITLDSLVQISIINSEFAGTVEQIEIFAEDSEYHHLLIQHDGKGHIVWLLMGDEFTTLPCRISEPD